MRREKREKQKKGQLGQLSQMFQVISGDITHLSRSISCNLIVGIGGVRCRARLLHFAWAVVKRIEASNRSRAILLGNRVGEYQSRLFAFHPPIDNSTFKRRNCRLLEVFLHQINRASCGFTMCKTRIDN